MKNLRWVALVCFLGLVMGEGSYGVTRYVNATNATPGTPYLSLATAATNIQQAIDASNTGDEILVAPGTYRIASTITIPNAKALTLRSTTSRAATIDAQRLCPALIVWGTNSVLEGFTIRNGMSSSYGGGITLYAASTVRDCLVVSNLAWGAGGIMIYTSSALVENCTIQSNVAETAGGVIFYNYSTSVVNKCIIQGNVASNDAGGVYFQHAGTVSNSWIADNRAMLTDAGGVRMNGGRLINSVVVGNRAQENGGGVYAAKGYIAHCTVVSNHAVGDIGGLYSSQSTSWNNIVYFNVAPTNANVYLEGNVASNDTGGVYFQGAGTVSNSWIADNRAMLTDAGGVRINGGRLINSVVVGNWAQEDGGGIYGAKGYIAHCTVVSNRAGEEIGGLYMGQSTSWNNIVYFNVAPTNANVAIDGNVFSNNCTTPSQGGSNFTNAPTFVDFAGRDFHLTSTSSCLERGATNPAVRIDYDGVTRPQQATVAGAGAYDVGAFEFRMGWDAGYTDIGGGWRRLNWFGDYSPMGGAGWNWHNKHGFLYAAPTSYEYDVWFYTQDMGWLWTSRTKYPFLFRASDGAWLWYNGSTNPRWFRNMTAGTWESRP